VWGGQDGVWQESVYLAVMVRLVIEQVAQNDPERGAEALATCVEIIERLVEARPIQALDHADQTVVLRDARDLQRGEITVEDLVERDLLGSPLDAAEPDAIANHDMVERRVDRAEETRARLQVLALWKLGAGSVEPGVGPGVVAREGAVIAIGHRILSSIPWRTP